MHADDQDWYYSQTFIFDLAVRIICLVLLLLLLLLLLLHLLPPLLLQRWIWSMSPWYSGGQRCWSDSLQDLTENAHQLRALCWLKVLSTQYLSCRMLRSHCFSLWQRLIYRRHCGAWWRDGCLGDMIHSVCQYELDTCTDFQASCI